jgi:hypothetical protein
MALNAGLRVTAGMDAFEITRAAAKLINTFQADPRSVAITRADWALRGRDMDKFRL